MALTLEDLDRRVTGLEKGAEREKTIERAVAEIVSESEQRVRAEMSVSEQRVRAEMSELRAEMSELRAEVKTETERLAERVSSSERRMVDILNDRFDQVMAALDRPSKP
jgi:multidrug resistance efflux pump